MDTQQPATPRVRDETRSKKKRAQRFAFSPPKLTLGSYDGAAARRRKSGRF